MRIEHLALWTDDVDRLCAFYAHWFGAEAGPLYESARRRGFRSRFLSFPDGGARLEVMAIAGIGEPGPAPARGYAHLAITLGSREAVIDLARRMHEAGIPIPSAPRETGDGYFEAVLLDPDGNEVEIVA